MDTDGIILIVLASAVLIGLAGSLLSIILQRKGIGWQFIRFNTVAIALPLAGLLSLKGHLNEAEAAIIAGALGYAFGKSDNEDNKSTGAPTSDAPKSNGTQPNA